MIFNYERDIYNKDCSRLTALYDTKLTNCNMKKNLSIRFSLYKEED